MTEKILVTGGSGQIGSELVPALQKKYGFDNVISLDMRKPQYPCVSEQFDMLENDKVEDLIKRHDITTIYHLVCILSATGEKKPYLTWKVNMETLKNVLDLAKEHQIRIFWPSSIAVFGATTPRNNTPQKTVMEPTTMYGITKSAGELLCNYYHHKFGVDVRSLRFPGIVSYKTEPGGGTTDFAVDVFLKALHGETYFCFVRKDTTLPMMYMDDAIRATLELMDAESDKLTVRTSYNLAAVSFSPEELAAEIQKHVPGIKVEYKPDKRQKIADSWPHTIDDSTAQRDWGWRHTFDLPQMTKTMIAGLKAESKTESKTVVRG